MRNGRQRVRAVRAAMLALAAVAAFAVLASPTPSKPFGSTTFTIR